MRNRTITYAIEQEFGQVISRVDDEVLWPVLDFEAIGKDGNYNAPFQFYLQKFPLHSIYKEPLVWTKHIPLAIKNQHRAVWGFPPLKEREYVLHVEGDQTSKLPFSKYIPQNDTTVIHIPAECMRDAKTVVREMLGKKRAKVYGW